MIASLALMIAPVLPAQACRFEVDTGASTGGAWPSLVVADDEVLIGYPTMTVPGSTNRGRVKMLSLSTNGQIQATGWLDNPVQSAGFSVDFGQSIARDGDRIAVNAPGDYSGATVGAVYLFVKNAAGAWNLEQRIESTVHAATGTRAFSGDLVLDGDTLFAGSTTYHPNGTPFCGRVYVYRRTGRVWTLSQTLESSVGRTYFGLSMDLASGVLVVGACGPTDYYRDSSVSFWEEVAGSWVETQVLIPTVAHGTFSGMGRDVAIEGDVTVVSGPGVAANGRRGAAEILRRDAAGTWTREAFLSSDRVAAWPPQDYGRHVEIDGARVVVSGFRREDAVGTEVWSQVCGTWSRSHSIGWPGVSPAASTVTAVALDSDRLVSTHEVLISSHDLTCTLGESYCDPNTENVTGLSGRLRASGSLSVRASALTLEASQLPPLSGGLMIFSQTAAISPFMGCGAQICVGGTIARGSTQALIADAAGGVSYAFNTLALPRSVGAGPVVPGDTWTFQYWHRNPDPALPATLTNAVMLQFE